MKVDQRAQEELATKVDLAHMREELRADFEQLGSRIIRALWIQTAAIVVVFAVCLFFLR